jgi:hypothetical protein
VLVPNVGDVGGIIDIVPDPLLWEFNVLERLGNKARLGFAGGLSARLRRINKLESLSNAHKCD